MKKRVKLLTTIASLCLAVALMAFGVYAATTTSFTINSNISFTASADDIYVAVTVTKTVGESSETVSAQTYTETDGAYTYAAPVANPTAFSQSELEAVGDTVTYTIKATNYTTTAGVTVKLSVSTLTLTQGSFTVLSASDNAATGISISCPAATTDTPDAVEASDEIVITLLRNDVTFNLAEVLTVNIDKAE